MLLLHEAIPQKNIGLSRCSSHQELLVSSLATAEAVDKLMIEKGLITQAEFIQKLLAEKGVYRAMLGKMR